MNKYSKKGGEISTLTRKIVGKAENITNFVKTNLSPMMKRFFFFALVLLSASACSSLFYNPQGTFNGVVNETVGGVVSGVVGELTPTEDPATGLYGYLNDVGIWVIKPQFKAARSFGDNLACVLIPQGWGAINPMGGFVIQPVFESSLDCEAAIRSMKRGRMVGIDMWEQQDVQTELYGYLNYYGNWQIAPQYEAAKSFNDDGYAVVKVKGGGWGAINRNNQFVIAPNFNSWIDANAALNRYRLH